MKYLIQSNKVEEKKNSGIKESRRERKVLRPLMENSCNLLYEQSPYLFYKDQLLKRNLGYNIMESESNPIYTFYTS